MDEASRMGRARAQGLDTDYYHGTNRDVQPGFRRSGSGAIGPGIYVARRPGTTDVFAGTPRGVDRDGQLNIEFGTGSNVIPLRGPNPSRMATMQQWDAALERAMRSQRGANPSDQAVVEAAQNELEAQGFLGISDPSRDFHNVFRPQNIRSRFAAFDPSRSGESDLMAALPLGLGIGGGLLSRARRERQRA